MTNLPIEHLSASSLNKHARCPRQWQNDYLFAEKGPSSSSLVIGSAVHTALQRLNQGIPVGNYWQETIDAEEYGIVWGRDTPEKAEQIAKAMVYHYWEMVGKHLQDGIAEETHLFTVPGVDIPIMAIIDFELPNELIDYKTTAYFSRKGVRPNKEWIIQQGIYQLKKPKPSQIHVLTRSKTDPVVVPSSVDDPLYIGRTDDAKILAFVQDEYGRMLYHMEKYGYDKPWPGNLSHDWAGKYCSVENCCKL